jgi:hypothetical protein
MNTSKKILNYTVMVCAIIAAILFFIDKDWNAFLWAIIAFTWVVNCHLTEDSYYDCKESLDKLTEDYRNTLIKHGKEVKELKDEIAEMRP